jgi:predicted nucleotidyltransferase
MNPDRIQAALEQAERDHDVRILLAIESGSRAWGFPSSDSDWDVRFIYVNKTARYLSIDLLRDVIETPLNDDLDLGGWDLRKALSLMVASNAIVLEWLGSPIVYRRDPDAFDALNALAGQLAYRPALAYHYDRLARRNWPPQQPGSMRLKDLFYALRPACALAWMQRHATPPPMCLPALMAGLPLPAAVTDAIEHLVALKQSSQEADAGTVPAVLAAFIDTALAHPAPRPDPWDRTAATRQANDLFRRILDLGA